MNNDLNRMNKILDGITLSCLSISFCISFLLNDYSSFTFPLLWILFHYFIFKILIIVYCEYKNRK